MPKTNTNTNHGSGNTNWNQISGKSGQGQGGSGDRSRGDCGNNCRNSLIVKLLFKEKMKDGCISKLTITGTWHWATQYKKIIDIIPVLCIGKNYRDINDILCNRIDLVEADSTPPYPNSNLWSNIYEVEITTVDQTASLLADSTCAPIIRVE